MSLSLNSSCLIIVVPFQTRCLWNCIMWSDSYILPISLDLWIIIWTLCFYLAKSCGSVEDSLRGRRQCLFILLKLFGVFMRPAIGLVCQTWAVLKNYVSKCYWILLVIKFLLVASTLACHLSYQLKEVAFLQCLLSMTYVLTAGLMFVCCVCGEFLCWMFICLY